MGKPVESLDVELFDWPDRWFVEREERDKEWIKFFNLPDTEPFTPYLVDLSELEEGWCGCRDFACNIMPHLHEPNHRAACKHILAARRKLYLLGTKPKTLPDTINL